MAWRLTAIDPERPDDIRKPNGRFLIRKLPPDSAGHATAKRPETPRDILPMGDGDPTIDGIGAVASRKMVALCMARNRHRAGNAPPN
jgi:hypothetical protein